MASSTKGNKVELSTFKSWGKENIIGYKTEVSTNGKIIVNYIWCKVCAAHKDSVLQSPSVKGNAKKSVLAFVSGTNVVTKYQVYICLAASFK